MRALAALASVALCSAGVPSMAGVGFDVEDKGRDVQEEINKYERHPNYNSKMLVHPPSPFDARQCTDIKSVHDCFGSKQKFGFECGGWGGHHCISKQGAKCGDLTVATICGASESLFGIKCDGFKNSHCQAPGAKLEEEAAVKELARTFLSQIRKKPSPKPTSK
eukprot:CAMPEP_0171197684 /NCGR_PEP_ID=MMETSP0790-20130122/22537_1 /TAXON_ID=2925 /ORGANISM="Alexandrium catenella, Strain OF101" /LENGTH=163 /DNA_ID=CAMNT_0011662931 /DNA_START=121 /DNA_END=612 /DNA_ORIENTATION=+